MGNGFKKIWLCLKNKNKNDVFFLENLKMQIGLFWGLTLTLLTELEKYISIYFHCFGQNQFFKDLYL